jgi:hypothetical protein
LVTHHFVDSGYCIRMGLPIDLCGANA